MPPSFLPRLPERLASFMVDLRRPGRDWRPAVLFALGLFIYPYFHAHYPAIPNPNEQVRVYLTHALATRASFVIDPEIKRFGPTLDRAVHSGKTYSDKAPGQSFLGVPALWPYLAYLRAVGEPVTYGGMLRWLKFWLVSLPGALFLPLLYWALGRYAPPRGIRFATVASYGFGTGAFTYAAILFSHQLTGVFLALAWFAARGAAERPRRRTFLAAAGALAGLATLTEFPALLPAIAVTAYAGAILSGRRLVALACVAAGATPFAVALLVYNAVCFGNPFSVGYANLQEQTFAAVHAAGLLGITHPTAESLYGTFLSPSRGLLSFAPWLAAAIPGWWVLYRRHRADALFTGAAVLAAALLVTSFGYWQGGGTVGPRHLTMVLPFAVAPIAALWARLAEFPVVWALAARAVLAGSAVAAMITYAVATPPFPFFSVVYANPVRDLAGVLWTHGFLPLNWGATLGFTWKHGAAPFAAIFAATVALAGVAAFHGVPRRRAVPVGLLAGAVCALLVVLRFAYEPHARVDARLRDVTGIMRHFHPRGASNEHRRALPPGVTPDWRSGRHQAVLLETRKALNHYRKGVNSPGGS